PSTDPSLYARMPYLAPEQLSAEPTSAATDVFQLGVMLYELLAGRPAYTGATSQDIAQAILAARLAMPDVARPLVKVLQRCLARSPFERSPDARALADAIDAAVRTAELSGGAHDVGMAVRDAMRH